MKKSLFWIIVLSCFFNSNLTSQTLIKSGLRITAGGVDLNGTLYFCGVKDGQPGLWRTNGTEAGTELLAQVGVYNFYPAGYTYYPPSKITKAAGKIFYAISEPDAKDTRGLYCYNPADNTNTRLSAFGPNFIQMMPSFVEFKNQLYFIGWEATYNKELWKSDGTDAGTTIVKDVKPGTFGGLMNCMKLYTTANYIYFSADDGSGKGEELWRSDGTEAGTIMIKDINPGSGNSHPNEFGDVNGVVYFSANDGTHGNDLWKSDGTEAGTVMVKDLGTPTSYSSPFGINHINGKVIFGYADDAYGYELWQSDGTSAGTSLLKDLNPGTGNSISVGNNYINLNGFLYFGGSDDAHGGELFRTDGTGQGTALVKDVYTGPSTSMIQQLTLCGNKMYFQAEDELNGNELWCSDGTEAGTHMVSDIFPGQYQSSYPNGIAAAGSKLFFSASPDGGTPNFYMVDGSTGVKDGNAEVRSFALNQNYPNPFNPSTRINFSLPERSDVTLKVYDMLGKEVAVLANGEMNPGSHTIEFSAGNLSSGLYIARLQAGTGTQTIKMNLVK